MMLLPGARAGGRSMLRQTRRLLLMEKESPTKESQKVLRPLQMMPQRHWRHS